MRRFLWLCLPVLQRLRLSLRFCVLSLTVFVVSVSSAMATRYVNPDIQAGWLGRGINSETGEFASHCLNGTTVVHQNKRLGFSLKNTKRAQDSLRETTGSVGASVNLGLFGGGASVTVHTQFSESTNTVSQVYHVQYLSHGESYEERSLNTLGENMVGQSDSTVLESCGDHYITYLQYGSDLYLAANLTFASAEEYREFVTKIKIKVLFWSSTTTIRDEFYDLAVNARYTVKAASDNALPSSISAALNNNTEMVCRANNVAAIAPCVDATQTIFDYLLNGTGYVDWLENQGNMHIVYFDSASYAGNGHRDFVNVSAPDISVLAQQSEYLASSLNYYQNLKDKLNGFISQPVGDISGYSAMLNNADANITYINNALAACRASMDETACQSAIDTAESQTVFIDF